MTVQEFCKLECGDVVEFPSYYGNQRGTVKSCDWHNECYGFVMGIDTEVNEEIFCHELTTGHKYLEITFIMDDGFERYVQSNRPDKIKDLRLIPFDEFFANFFKRVKGVLSEH